MRKHIMKTFLSIYGVAFNYENVAFFLKIEDKNSPFRDSTDKVILPVALFSYLWKSFFFKVKVSSKTIFNIFQC